MSAPKRKGRAAREGDPALFTPPASCDTTQSNSTAEQFDFDKRVVDQVDWSIWQAIFNGHFRLAVRCDVCGRWLTAGRSKEAHRGPRCAAKAGK
jgi:hypothetical protein